MASGKNARQKALDKQAQEAQAEGKAAAAQFNTILAKQQEPTANQKELDKQNLETLQYKGDYSGLPGTNWATGQVAMLKDESRKENRAAYTMAGQYADPNLLAAQGKQEEARAAQADQLGFEGAVEGKLASARGEGMNLSALTQQRLATSLGGAGNMYQNASGVGLGYSHEANQLFQTPGIWSQAMLGLISAGGTLGGAAITKSDSALKTNIQHPNGDLYATWDWNEKANAIGLFGSSQGVIAQELASIHPELVSTASNGYLQVDYFALAEKGILV